MDAQRRYSLWLAFAMGDRLKHHNYLLEEYGDAERVFYAARSGEIHPRNRLDETFLPLLKSKATETYTDRCLAYLEKNNICTVLPADSNYPALLREIHLPPTVLYVKGRLPESIRNDRLETMF